MAVKKITSVGLQDAFRALEKKENSFLSTEVENEGGDGTN